MFAIYQVAVTAYTNNTNLDDGRESTMVPSVRTFTNIYTYRSIRIHIYTL